VRIITGMLDRRSLLIGATVQAINVAIHTTAEQPKTGNSKDAVLEMNRPIEINQ
jgi:hypothetical protein